MYNMEPGQVHDFKDFLLQSFPWGTPLTPPEKVLKTKLQIALVHQYVWTDGTGYPGASPEAHMKSGLLDGMGGWDVIVYGDNHKGFLIQGEIHSTIFNCGTLQRRKADEIDYKPGVGLIYQDGTVEPHYLDTTADIITGTSVASSEEKMDLGDFLEGLNGLQNSQLDFTEAMKHALDKRDCDPAVRQLVLEAME